MKGRPTTMNNARDDVNTPVIAVIGVLSTIGMFAIIILLVAVFYRVQTRQEYVKDVSQPPVEVTQLAAEQQANLADYRRLDRESQVYAIPIRRAMELVVARRRENPEGPPGVEPPEQTAPPAESQQTEPKVEGGEP